MLGRSLLLDMEVGLPGVGVEPTPALVLLSLATDSSLWDQSGGTQSSSSLTYLLMPLLNSEG